MAALRSQQSDYFLEFRKASRTSCKQQLSLDPSDCYGACDASHMSVTTSDVSHNKYDHSAEAETASLRSLRKLKVIWKLLLRKSNNRYFVLLYFYFLIIWCR